LQQWFDNWRNELQLIQGTLEEVDLSVLQDLQKLVGELEGLRDEIIAYETIARHVK
jgi:hypothetical protein